jgi:hypothetical protein
MCSNSPAYLCVLCINPSLKTSDLDITAANLSLSTQYFEIFICRLAVGMDSPGLGENIVVGVLEDFEIREVAIIDNFRVNKHRTRWFLKGCKSIVALDCTANCSTAARECLGNVLSQFIP